MAKTYGPDSTLGVTVSTVKGHGEDTMMAFIKTHMGSILQPFADHVDELHQALSKLDTDFHDTKKVVEQHGAKLLLHTSEIAALRKDQQKTQEDVTDLQRGLGVLEIWRGEITEDHEKTKVRVGVSEKRVDLLEVDMKAQQEALVETNNSVQELKAEIGGVASKVENEVQPAIRQNAAEIVRLDNDQQVSRGHLETTQRELDSTRKQLEAFSLTTDRKYDDTSARLAHIQQTLMHNTTLLNEMEHRVRTNAEHLKTISKMVTPLKARTEDVDRAIHALQQLAADSNTHTGHLAVRCDNLQAALKEVAEKAIRSEDSLKKVANMPQAIGELTALINKNRAAIMKLTSGHEAHASYHSRNDNRAADIERSQTRLDARMERANASLLEKISQLALRPGEGDHKGQEDATARHFQDTEFRLKRLQNELIHTNGRVSELESELAAANEQVAKLSAGLDLTQEYWKGLSKGFQETHRSVAVDNEMLPPKGMHGITLPTLSKVMPPPGSPAGPQRHTVCPGASGLR